MTILKMFKKKSEPEEIGALEFETRPDEPDAAEPIVVNGKAPRALAETAAASKNLAVRARGALADDAATGPEAAEPVMESAQGSSIDFRPVSDYELLSPPYGSVCKLLIEYEWKPGKQFAGTGFLIRSNMILTAGHNLFKEGHGRALRIKVLFQNGGLEPFAVTGYRAAPKWKDAYLREVAGKTPAYNNADDFGVLLVKAIGKSKSIPKLPIRLVDVGWIESLFSVDFKVAGFSAKKQVNKFTLDDYRLYRAAERVAAIDVNKVAPEYKNVFDKYFASRVVKHMADTAPGFSGCPLVCRTKDTDGAIIDTAVAIHIMGCDEFNLARIIDAEMLKLLKEWATAS